VNPFEPTRQRGATASMCAALLVGILLVAIAVAFAKLAGAL